jgi:TorA maturation chaperone TorD
MGQALSALDVAKAAEWFALAISYPEDNATLSENMQSVEPWLIRPEVFVQARDRVEYTSLFDLGNPEPPAPLMESQYQQDRQARLRQVVTFYRTYGVINETEFAPDHLCVELSFLSFLASLANDYPDRADLKRAYGFFAKVHLSSWLGQVVMVLEKEAPDSVWTELLKALVRFADDVAGGLEIPFDPAAEIEHAI